MFPRFVDISVFMRPEFDDTHLYTSNTTVAQVIDGVFCELELDPPLDPNVILSGVVHDVASQLGFLDVLEGSGERGSFSSVSFESPSHLRRTESCAFCGHVFN
jgi:hypothetical protein